MDQTEESLVSSLVETSVVVVVITSNDRRVCYLERRRQRKLPTRVQCSLHHNVRYLASMFPSPILCIYYDSQKPPQE